MFYRAVTRDKSMYVRRCDIFHRDAGFLQPNGKPISNSNSPSPAHASVALLPKVISKMLNVGSERTRPKSFDRSTVFEKSFHKSSVQQSFTEVTGLCRVE